MGNRGIPNAILLVAEAEGDTGRFMECCERGVLRETVRLPVGQFLPERHIIATELHFARSFL
jgi:hypothetical protein